ncbi:MAG TPA: hypothetical protein VFQ92_08840 [Blastocatellia bacterium]|nr:hypothetical protein [Blastocatellia bacterium]
MITGIPNYSDRAIQSLRCKCGVRFVVLIGSEDHEEAAKFVASRLNADFIDARKILAFECYCGEMIDVSQEATSTVQ